MVATASERPALVGAARSSWMGRHSILRRDALMIYSRISNLEKTQTQAVHASAAQATPTAIATRAGTSVPAVGSRASWNSSYVRCPRLARVGSDPAAFTDQCVRSTSLCYSCFRNCAPARTDVPCAVQPPQRRIRALRQRVTGPNNRGQGPTPSPSVPVSGRRYDPFAFATSKVKVQ